VLWQLCEEAAVGGSGRASGGVYAVRVLPGKGGEIHELREAAGSKGLFWMLVLF